MEKITELKPNEVFVFGSNLAGKHGKGAAKDALKWGAVYGVEEGLKGQTYAIPTKDKNIKPMYLFIIREYVNNFINFANENPHLTFLVTEIGCGLARYSPFDIAPLFDECLDMDNVKLPEVFYNVLKRGELREEFIQELEDCKDEVFWDYVSTWYDPEQVMDIMRDWTEDDVDFKIELEQLRNIKKKIESK